jgi:hypothetical protein
MIEPCDISIQSPFCLVLCPAQSPHSFQSSSEHEQRFWLLANFPGSASGLACVWPQGHDTSAGSLFTRMAAAAAAASSRLGHGRRSRRSSAVVASDWAEVVATAVQEAQSAATTSDSDAAPESKAGDEGGFSSFDHLVRSAKWDEDRVVRSSRSIAALRGFAGMPRAQVDMLAVIARQTVQGLLALRQGAQEAHDTLHAHLVEEQERVNLERRRADVLDRERTRLLAVVAAQEAAARAASTREAAQAATIARLEDLVRALRSGEPRVTNQAMQRAVHAATTLQRLWRGYWCRHRYRRVLRRLVFGEVSLPPLRGLGGGLRAARTDVIGALMMHSPSSHEGTGARSFQRRRPRTAVPLRREFGVDGIVADSDQQTSLALEAAAHGEWAMLNRHGAAPHPVAAAAAVTAAAAGGGVDTDDGASVGSWARASTVVGAHPPSPLRLGTQKHSRATRAAEMLRLPPPRAVRAHRHRRGGERDGEERINATAPPASGRGPSSRHRRHQRQRGGQGRGAEAAGAAEVGAAGPYSPAGSDGMFAALRETASLIPQPTPLELPPQRHGAHTGGAGSNSRSMTHGASGPFGSDGRAAAPTTPPPRHLGSADGRRSIPGSSRAVPGAESPRGGRRAGGRGSGDGDSDDAGWLRHRNRRPVLSAGSESPDRQLDYDGAVTSGNQSSVGGGSPSLGSPDSFAILARMGHGAGPNPDDLGSVHGMGHQQGRF